MPLNELLLREYEMEMANTQKTLERVPVEHWDWKPQEKSGTLGWMAGHVATLPGFTWVTLSTPELNMGGSNADFPRVTKHSEMLPKFNELRQLAREQLAKATDEQLKEPWTLRRGDTVIFTMPRYDVLRLFCMNHIIHHRGQLTMYLRALGVPVPALYGPSADEGQM